MQRVVIVKSKDGRELGRYTFTLSWGETKTPDYFKEASQKALKDKLVTAADIPSLQFEFAP